MAPPSASWVALTTENWRAWGFFRVALKLDRASHFSADPVPDVAEGIERLREVLALALRALG